MTETTIPRTPWLLAFLGWSVAALLVFPNRSLFPEAWGSLFYFVALAPLVVGGFCLGRALIRPGAEVNHWLRLLGNATLAVLLLLLAVTQSLDFQNLGESTGWRLVGALGIAGCVALSIVCGRSFLRELRNN